MLKVINLFGGPCIGKSVLAAELFVIMKKQGYKVELVSEKAKSLTYSEDFSTLKDQLLVLAIQNHKLFKLRDKVEYAVVDSPLLLNLAYFSEDLPYSYPTFSNTVLDAMSVYENYNFLLDRSFDYQEYGRAHSLEESLGIDNKIKEVLVTYKIPHKIVDPSNAALAILASIL